MTLRLRARPPRAPRLRMRARRPRRPERLPGPRRHQPERPGPRSARTRQPASVESLVVEQLPHLVAVPCTTTIRCGRSPRWPTTSRRASSTSAARASAEPRVGVEQQPDVNAAATSTRSPGTTSTPSRRSNDVLAALDSGLASATRRARRARAPWASSSRGSRTATWRSTSTGRGWSTRRCAPTRSPSRAPRAQGRPAPVPRR
jgi:hypothetical protein